MKKFFNLISYLLVFCCLLFVVACPQNTPNTPAHEDKPTPTSGTSGGTGTTPSTPGTNGGTGTGGNQGGTTTEPGTTPSTPTTPDVQLSTDAELKFFEYSTKDGAITASQNTSGWYNLWSYTAPKFDNATTVAYNANTFTISVQPSSEKVSKIETSTDNENFTLAQKYGNTKYYRATFTLSGSELTCYIRVTAEDGKTSIIYTVKVTKETTTVIASTDATIKTLETSYHSNAENYRSLYWSYIQGVSADVTSYNITVPYSESSFAVRINPNDAKASVLVSFNNATNKKCDYSNYGEIEKFNLTAGKHTIKFKITAEDGTTTKEYTLNVTKENPPATLSTDATLKTADTAWDRSKGPWNSVPGFSSTTYNYSAPITIPASEAFAYVSVSTTDSKVSSVSMKFGSGDFIPVQGKAGENTGTVYYTEGFAAEKAGNYTAHVKVIAEDGKTEKTYTFNFVKEAAATPEKADSSLSSIKVSYNPSDVNYSYGSWALVSGFSSTVFNYTINDVSIKNNDVLVRVQPTDSNIKGIEIQLDNGTKETINKDYLDRYTKAYKVTGVGSHTIKITVTASDNTTSTYTLSFNLVAENNANLSAIYYSNSSNSLGQNTQGWNQVSSFNVNTTSYALPNIPNTQDALLIRVKPEVNTIQKVEMQLDSGAATTVSAGTYGYEKAFTGLSAGNHAIKITVTAEDGSTTKTTTLSFTKEAAPSTPVVTNDASLVSIETASDNTNNTTWVSVPSFNSTTTNYNIGEIITSNIFVSVKPKAENATVQMKIANGSYVNITAKNGYYTNEFTNLPTGDSTVSILVTAGTLTKTYTVSFTRPQQQRAKYGILLYGAGGGNLDAMLDGDLKEARQQGTNANVKMAAEYRYSAGEQRIDWSGKDKRGTFRQVLDGKEWKTLEVKDVNYDMGKASSLEAFLRWGQQVIPAEQYILILWNHGDVWSPGFDDPTPRSGSRAVIFDDNTNTALSTASTTKAIVDSGVNVKVIYYDVCLMLMLETLEEVRQHAPGVEYVMGAEHITPGRGGDYTALLNVFGDNTGNLENKLSRYVQTTVTNHWNNINYGGREPDSHDLSVVRMRDFNDVIVAMKDVTDTLVALGESNIKNALNYAYRNRYQKLNPGQINKSTDVVHFLSAVASYLGNQQVNTKLQALKDAITGCFVVNEKNRHCRIDPTIAIYINYNYNFNNYGYNYMGDGYTNSEGYLRTLFDLRVKWSRIINMIEG